MSALPVGFRFHPTEEELINHYLKNKIHGSNFDNIIPEIDICKCEPWDLPAFSPIESDDEEWFYFSRPEYKSTNNRSRANRATERGFWKITGREREIRAKESKAVVGKKRTLTFYKGKVRSGQKTSWVIHEYYIPENLLPDAARQRDFVLCRLKKKDEGTDIGACDEGEPNTNNVSAFENLLALLDAPYEGEPCTNNASDLGNFLASFQEIGLQGNIRTEEIVGTLFPSPESPQSHDYLSSMLRNDILCANAGNDNHNELQYAFGGDESENEEYPNLFVRDEENYVLEERSHSTLRNHSSEPKSLSRVYVEEVHQQDKILPVAPRLPTRERNIMLLSQLLQKNASYVKVASNIPRNIGRVQSLTDETDYEASEVLQCGNNVVSRTLVADKSSMNESWPIKGDMVRTNQPEVQTGQGHPFTTAIAQSSYKGHTRHGFKPKQVEYTSKLAEIPKVRPSKSPEKPMEPPRSDEQKVMKQIGRIYSLSGRIGTKAYEQTIGDWKDSFIVWKDSPLILKSHPPVVYTWNLVGGLILLMFVVGDFFSYGNWC